MFSTIVLAIGSIAAFASGVASVPIAQTPNTLAARSISFNNWGGFNALNNFDNFYGIDNFANFNFEQIIVQDQVLVCQVQQIDIVQQRLVVLQEVAKRVILEQICEVEVQAIVFEQFFASLGDFNRDLRRESGRRIGFDVNIVNRFGEFFNDDGSLSNHNFGFNGRDLGKNIVVIGGNNWDDSRSFESVNRAFLAAQEAH